MHIYVLSPTKWICLDPQRHAEEKMWNGWGQWLLQRPWQWFAVGGHPQTKHDQMTAMTSRKTVALL